jgi:uncharacterized protein
MTPEESKLVTELFDRLAALEDAPRDREAEGLILDGLRQAPNATYALVQTVLVQDETLKRADARIRELEDELANSAAPPRQGGFLDSMRDSVWGRRDAPRAGSVPTVRPSDAPATGAPMGVPPGYRTEAQPVGAAPMGQPAGGGGGSFLGTAAATAAGVIGGTLLMNSMRGMMGGGQHGSGSAHAAVDPASGGSSSPWGGGSGGTGGSGNSDLARQAGLDDIGRGSGSRDSASADRAHGLADSNTANAAPLDVEHNEHFDEDDSGDFGGDFGGEDE